MGKLQDNSYCFPALIILLDQFRKETFLLKMMILYLLEHYYLPGLFIYVKGILHYEAKN